MKSLQTPLAVLLQASFLMLPALLVTDGTAVRAIAQERSDRDRDRDNDDDYRDDSRSSRRGFFRRDRDRDRDDERDSDSDRENEDSSRKTSESKSEAKSDTPSLSVESWAKGHVKKYDKNGNSWLDGDEIAAAGRSTQAADLNGDKVVTIDELVANASKGSSKSTSSATATAKPAEASDDSGEAGKDSDERAEDEPRESRRGIFGSRGSNRSSTDASKADANKSATSKRVYTWTGGNTSGDEKKSAKRTYRFTPASERLPDGLPSWFKSQDKNGDGQVVMSEYSRTWSRSTVSRFRRYDLNEDGVITAREAMAK